MDLDLSIGRLYIPENLEDIERFVKLDEYSFVAIAIDGNIVTHVFWYTESSDDMVVIVDIEETEDNEKFENILFNYIFV